MSKDRVGLLVFSAGHCPRLTTNSEKYDLYNVRFDHNYRKEYKKEGKKPFFSSTEHQYIVWESSTIITSNCTHIPDNYKGII